MFPFICLSAAQFLPIPHWESASNVFINKSLISDIKFIKQKKESASAFSEIIDMMIKTLYVSAKMEIDYILYHKTVAYV